MNILINGDLIIHGFPDTEKKARNRFIVYRMLDDQAWFWHISDDKISAVSLASSMCGHVVKVQSVERS